MSNVKFPDMNIHEELLNEKDNYKLINMFCDELKIQLPSCGYSKREAMTQVTKFLFECQEYIEKRNPIGDLIRLWANVQ